MDNSTLGQISQGIIDQQQQQAAQNTRNTSDAILSGPSLQAELSKQLQQPDQNAAPQQPSAPQPAKNSGDGGNWFTHLLPTAGSVLGSIAGTLLDPVTAGLGTIGGGAAGSALGKGIENLVEGKGINLGDEASAAGEGALGGVVGGIGGAALGKVASMAGKTAADGIANVASKEAADKAVEEAQAIRNTWGGIPAGLLKTNNLADTQDLAKAIGIDHNSPQAFVETGNHANDVLNELINSSLQKTGGVDTNGLTDILKNAINQKAGTLGSLEPVALKKGLIGPNGSPASKLYGQLQGELGGLFNSKAADPLALREATSRIGGLLADAKPGIAANGAKDPVQVATHGVLGDVYSQLKNLLYNRPEVINEIKNASGGLSAEDVGGNQLLADHLNSAINAAQHPQDIIDQLSGFTRMGVLGKAGLESAQNPATAAALNAAKQEVPELSTVAPAIKVEKPSPVQMITKALGAVGNGGKTSQVAVKLDDMLNQTAKFVPENAPGSVTNAGLLGRIAGGVAATSPNFSQQAGDSSAVANLPAPHSTGNIMADIMNSQSAAALPAKMAIIDSMYRGVGDNTNYLSDPTVAQSLGTVQGVQSAEAQLNDYIKTLNAAGGAQGMGGGLLSELSGVLTGGNAHAAHIQQQQLEATLERTLGHPVNLPGLTSTQSAANSILGQIQSQLGSYGGNSY